MLETFLFTLFHCDKLQYSIPYSGRKKLYIPQFVDIPTVSHDILTIVVDRIQSLEVFDAPGTPGTPRFLWPLQQVWKWNLSPRRFLQDTGPGNHAFACFANIRRVFCEHLGARSCGFDSILATLWSSNLSFPIVGI